MKDYIKFNYHNKMISTLRRGITALLKTAPYFTPAYRCRPGLAYRPFKTFCSSKDLPATTPAAVDQEVKVSTAKVGEQEVEVVQTKDSVSIMDRVPGVKADNGEMYVLSFTCTKCERKSIRSFTKHAYHKGVVLVRCGGCENIHLVADNIGWFEDKPINVQTMHEGKVRRIQDPLLIGKFLETAFKQDSEEQQPRKLAE